MFFCLFLLIFSQKEQLLLYPLRPLFPPTSPPPPSVHYWHYSPPRSHPSTPHQIYLLAPPFLFTPWLIPTFYLFSFVVCPDQKYLASHLQLCPQERHLVDWKRKVWGQCLQMVFLAIAVVDWMVLETRFIV